MRALVVVCSAIAFLPAASAQDQERKLVDRLLRPDTSMQNNAQNKKFAAEGALVEKRATVSAFYLPQRNQPATFSGTGEFPTARFNSRAFHDRNRSNVLARKQASDSSESYATFSMTRVPNARDAKKESASRTFAGQRPFLEQGKSQKSLDRKNPPLTIEQVRELLNKNK
jgi:hypothetical protein